MIQLLKHKGYFSQALNQALRLAEKDQRILFYGEQGVGKRTLVQLIHESLQRKSLKFIDCEKNEDILEKNLFGYRDEYGVFHKGILEEQDGGTLVFLYLDKLSESFQKKLADIFERLSDYGLNLCIAGLVEIESGRSVNPLKMDKKLIYYFQNQTMFIQPLKKRQQECEDLVNYFFQHYCNVLQKKLFMSSEIKSKLIQKNYKGNITELKELIEDLVTRATDEITLNHLVSVGSSRNMYFENSVGIELMTIRQAEIVLIQKALIHTNENRTKAARILGVSIRTLRNKINQYRQSGIDYFLNLR
jgi:two-component system response regulator FlrC